MAATLAAVQRVASLYPTAIISGRSREKVYEFVRIPELYYAGSHGLDIVGPTLPASAGAGSVETREVVFQPAPWAPAVMDAVYQQCVAAIADIPGATVEHNKFCVSVHYRNCAPKDWGRVKAVVDKCVEQDTERLKWAEGRKVFEVKPRRGGRENKPSTDIESTKNRNRFRPLLARVRVTVNAHTVVWGSVGHHHHEPSPRPGMSIHPEDKSCGHIRSGFECLFSSTLLPGWRGTRARR